MDIDENPNSSYNTIIKDNEIKKKRSDITTCSKIKHSPKRNHTNSTNNKTKNNKLQSDLSTDKQTEKAEEKDSQCTKFNNTLNSESDSNHRKRSCNNKSRHSDSQLDITRSTCTDSFSNVNIRRRIIPQCFRRASTPYQNRFKEVLRSEVDNHQQDRRPNRNENVKYKDHRNHRSRCRHKHKKKQKDRISLSSISSASLKDPLESLNDDFHNLSYDDISITSLKTHAEKPMSSKTHTAKLPFNTYAEKPMSSKTHAAKLPFNTYAEKPVSSKTHAAKLRINTSDKEPIAYKSHAEKSKSFYAYAEKPLPFKRKKHCKHTHAKQTNELKKKEELQESKLDMLIRRTKERERKQVEQSRTEYNTCFTSTPIHNEFSSGDFPITSSDMDISIESQTTLLIETYQSPYSPSSPIGDLHQSSDTEKLSYPGYSPSSPSRKDYKMKIPAKHDTSSPVRDLYQSSYTDKLSYRGFSSLKTNEDYKMRIPENNNNEVKNNNERMKIKNEPVMDIGAYSPIKSPTESTQKLCMIVKKECDFKKEPLFSSRISPIYLSDEDALQFFKPKNVKNE